MKIAPVSHVLCRPPIMHAAAAVGLRDADIARFLSVSTVTVHQWAHGQRPIPRIRHIALGYVVAGLVDLLKDEAAASDGQRRARLTVGIAAAEAWLFLSRDELSDWTKDVDLAAFALLNKSDAEGFLSQEHAKQIEPLLEKTLAEEEEEEATDAREAAS